MELENIKRQQCEFLGRHINDTDFVGITKREKTVSAINAKIDNAIDIDTRLSSEDLIIPLLYGEKCEEHPTQFSEDVNTYLVHTNIPPCDRKVAIETVCEERR